MQVTVDKLGRVVIPKAIREALHLEAGDGFDLVVDGVGIRLEPIRTATRPIKRVEGFPVLERVEGATLTDDDLDRLRDLVRR